MKTDLGKVKNFNRHGSTMNIERLARIVRNGGRWIHNDLDADLAIMKTALRFILEHGWVQGQGGNLDSGMCFRGAMTAAVIEHHSGKYPDWSHRWHPKTWEFLMERIVPYENIPDWNDAKGRTEAEVIALYRAVIAYIEQLLGVETVTEKPQELVTT